MGNVIGVKSSKDLFFFWGGSRLTSSLVLANFFNERAQAKAFPSRKHS